MAVDRIPDALAADLKETGLVDSLDARNSLAKRRQGDDTEGMGLAPPLSLVPERIAETGHKAAESRKNKGKQERGKVDEVGNRSASDIVGLAVRRGLGVAPKGSQAAYMIPVAGLVPWVVE